MAERVVRRRDASRNRERILEVFGQALARSEQVTLDEVARRAGVGIATLYRHFPSREALQRSLYAEVVHDEVLPLVRSFAGTDPRTAFIEAGLALVELVSRYQVPGGPPLDLPALAAEMDDDLREPLTALFCEGREVGALRHDLDADDGLWLLQLLSAGFSVPAATPDVRRRYLSLIFDALTPGERSPLPERG